MFTGIIEAVGKIEEIREEGSNRHYKIASPISGQLKVDQSVSHNGVCLTVTKPGKRSHWVTAVKETLEKSNLGSKREGDPLNIERSMRANGRFDGHIVQGHVDQTAVVIEKRDEGGSFRFVFEYDSSTGNMTVEKGSISVDGVSLTCFDSRAGRFSVVIIPYTFENTSFSVLKQGDKVNIEFDIIGKYVRGLLGSDR